MLENVDTHTYGDKRADHIIRYCVKCIFDTYFIKENVIQNKNSGINSIRRSRQKNVSVVHREILMTVVSSSTKENRLVKSMAGALGTSGKTLHKHRKFRLQIDVNDELTFWTFICRNNTKIDLEKILKKLYMNIE